MNREIKRGDIYFANFNPVIGSEQGGIRPCVVIQNDLGNRCSPTVIVAAITSKAKNIQPTHCPLYPIHGIARDSLVLLEQIRTIDKRRLIIYTATVDELGMKQIDSALTISVGL